MTISVIIPAYNEEKILPETLDSLWKLSRIPDEVIVVNGGSTDKTAQVAKKHRARVLTVPHRGIGFARQKGLEAAAGDIVAFTDADTIVPGDWLTKIEKTLAAPGVVGMFGSFRVPGGWWPYRIYINYVQPIFNGVYWYLFRLPMAPGQNTAFLRKEGVQVGGYPEDFKIAEDIEMARRLMTIGKLVYRPDCIVVSSGRRGNEGLTMFTRIFKAFFLYFIFRKANKIGFPDIR